MIQSMTGYGSSEYVADGASYLLEIRTVNHRYLKVAVRLPDPWQFAESAVDQVIRDRLSRGSVFCSLRVQMSGGGRLCPVNLEVLQGYIDQLSHVRLSNGISPTLDLGSLVLLPGVTRTMEFDDEARRNEQSLLVRLTERAVEDVRAMRRREGAALRAALLGACEDIKTLMAAVSVRAPVVLEEYHLRLVSRVGLLVERGGYSLDAEGLAREVALYAERSDISEEVTRLTSHLEQFAALCEREEPVGRTLDFLAQELLREANTIGSKSNDAAITRHIVEVKGLVDRLKEQVQNVE